MTTQHTQQPARVKSYRPWPAGSARYSEVHLSLAGGAKGTGKLIARGHYTHPLTRERAENLQQNLTEVAAAHGYTIVHWPKELRLSTRN